MRLMRKHVNRCDAVIEVHDARIPFTARNDKFDLLADKPRILVLNKGDLAGSKNKDWRSNKALVTDCTLNSSPQVMQIVPRLLDVVDPGKRVINVLNMMHCLLISLLIIEYSGSTEFVIFACSRNVNLISSYRCSGVTSMLAATAQFFTHHDCWTTECWQIFAHKCPTQDVQRQKKGMSLFFIIALAV